MTTTEAREQSGGQADGGLGVHLSPAAIRRMHFPRAPLGRRGLLESDVDRFCSRVADELARADHVKAELRAENQVLRREVQRLHDYFRDQRVDPALADPTLTAPGATPGEGAPDPRAVTMMSMAQQAADQHIAQAEHYARQLIGDARRQYEDILVTSQLQAEEAAATAAHLYRQTTAPEARSPERAELLSKVAYLRTFAAVTQVQMRSILDALRQELEQLTGPGDLGDPGDPGDPADPGRGHPVPADPARPPVVLRPLPDTDP
jgi:cell division initiation protein